MNLYEDKTNKHICRYKNMLHIRRSNTYMFGYSVSILRDVLYKRHITKTSKNNAKILNIKL